MTPKEQAVFCHVHDLVFWNEVERITGSTAAITAAVQAARERVGEFYELWQASGLGLHEFARNWQHENSKRDSD
jgi:hypothetical protein